MLQRNEIISDYLLVSRIFLHLTVSNLQKMLDNMLLSHFLKDLTADYRFDYRVFISNTTAYGVVCAVSTFFVLTVLHFNKYPYFCTRF